MAKEEEKVTMAKEEEQVTTETIAEVVEEEAEELIDNAIEAEEKTEASVADTLRNAVSSAKNAMNTVKTWGTSASSAIGGALSTFGEWREEGTPLRRVFRAARLDLEDARVRGHDARVKRSQFMKERAEKKADGMKTMRERMDRSGTLTKCAEIKTQHPELIVGGVTLAVALPSALAGKRVFFRNGTRALVASAVVVYGSEWYKRQRARRAEKGLDQ